MSTPTLASLVFACLAGLPLVAGAAPGASAAETETVTLAFQDQVALAQSKLNVHFVGYRDTRCPSDVTCAWAGEARAFFWIAGGDLTKPQLVTLEWDGAAQPGRKSIRVGSHRFYLQSLEPRPLQASRVPSADYKAVLQVSR